MDLAAQPTDARCPRVSDPRTCPRCRWQGQVPRWRPTTCRCRAGEPDIRGWRSVARKILGPTLVHA